MSSWWKRQAIDVAEERAAVVVERERARDLLHQAADLVFEIRSAAERMEQVIAEMGQEKEADGDDPPA